MALQALVGVLALQGAFFKHIEMLSRLGVRVVQVKKPKDLEPCEALILPGGESPTLFKQIDWIGLTEPLLSFAAKKPIFGTCAGLILMAKEIVGQKNPKPFGWLEITLERNGWGRQIESFKTHLAMSTLQGASSKKNKGFLDPLEAIFIRAPRIKDVGKEVTVLAKYQGEPVLVAQGKHLGATFHPELGTDLTLHRYFLEMNQLI